MYYSSICSTALAPLPPPPHLLRYDIQLEPGMSSSRGRGRRRHSGEAVDEAVEEINAEKVELRKGGGKQGEGLQHP